MPFVAEGHPAHEHLTDQPRVAAAQAKAAKPDYKPEFFDAHQLQTIESLAERVVPGSSRARVAPFLDSLLSVSAPSSQGRFLGSLGAFEMLAIERYSRPWKQLTPTEQIELLTIASTASAASMNESSEPVSSTIKVPIRTAFDDLRGWISGAYYSSEIGMRELGWTGQMFYDALPSCDHPDEHRGDNAR